MQTNKTDIQKKKKTLNIQIEKIQDETAPSHYRLKQQWLPGTSKV